MLRFFCIFFLPESNQMGPLKRHVRRFIRSLSCEGLTFQQMQKSDKSCSVFFCTFFLSPSSQVSPLIDKSGGLLDPGLIQNKI